MRIPSLTALTLACLAMGTGLAAAACDGSTGRGWASGKGTGSYEMTGSGPCLIPFVGFFSNGGQDFTEATEVSLRKAPKSGTVGLTRRGITYTPNAGFKGRDE